MLSISKILGITGITERKFTRLKEQGLIQLGNNKGHYRGKGEGKVYYEDTIKRIEIINNVLKCSKSLLEAAFELFLRGYSLPPELVRDALVMHLERSEQLMLNRRRHKDRQDTSPVAVRDWIHRSTKTRFPQLNDKERKILETCVQYMSGVSRKIDKEWYGLPPADYRYQREILQQTSPLEIKEAVKKANQLILKIRYEIQAFFAQMPLTQEELIHSFLPGHHCMMGHSYLHVMRPLAVWYYLMSANEEDFDKMQHLFDDFRN